MDLTSTIFGFLLLVPPLIIGGFWWMSVRPGGRHANALPDGEATILTRAGGLICTVLPLFQMFAWIIRYRTGALGRYLWYVVPAFGLLFAILVVAAFLSYTRGYERRVASLMVLLSVCTLLLMTLVGRSG